MGSKCSPAVACTFMAHFEQKFINQYPLQPLLWKRYVGDVVSIWQHGEEELMKFLEFLNNCHEHIKFNLSYSTAKVDFLDTTLRCDEDGVLSTTLYCKPNDSQYDLQYDSAHYEAVKRGLPYSEFLRVRCACTDDWDFHTNCALLAYHCIRRGYFKVLCLTYRALNNSAPSYIQSLITKQTPTRSLRSNTKLTLVVPRANTLSYGERAFSHFAPRQFNKLPETLKLSATFAAFKSGLKTHLFKTAYS